MWGVLDQVGIRESTTSVVQNCTTCLGGPRRESLRSSCRWSVAGTRNTRDEGRICGKPAGQELREKPHALGLARFAVRENPECAVLVQDGARRSCQQGIGISDE